MYEITGLRRNMRVNVQLSHWCSKGPRVFPRISKPNKPVAVSECETCAERGRPNEPAYKLGMCKFCYHGLPHPRATREQLARESVGVHFGSGIGSILKHVTTCQVYPRGG